MLKYSHMTQDLTSWQGQLEPVLVCCWNASLKLGNNKVYLVNEVELLELPQQRTEGRVKNFREVGKLEWLSYVQPENIPVDNVPWEGPENTSLIKAVKNVLRALLRSSMVAVFYESEFKKGKTAR